MQQKRPCLLRLRAQGERSHARDKDGVRDRLKGTVTWVETKNDDRTNEEEKKK